jgi:signal transduction histidine kinase
MIKNELQYLQKIASLESELEELHTKYDKNTAQSNKILTEQSKLAAMGEMIGNIAHQWRQPLMEISSILMRLEAKIKIENSLSKKEVLEAIERSNKVTKYMSNTIDDFREFFVKEREKSLFKISEQVKRAANIITTTLSHKNIKLDIIIKSNPSIYGYKNEYSQVLINLITNAKDILLHRNVEQGYIVVKIYQDGDKCITEVSDNGGGVTVEPFEKIFEPFFTVEKKDGTGVGLFMAKLIVEDNMDGKLTVSNTKEGALFKIELPLKV